MKKVHLDSSMLMVAVVAAVVSSLVSTSVLTGSMRRLERGSTVREIGTALERQERTIERIHSNAAANEALHGSAQQEKFVRSPSTAYRACVRIFGDIELFEISGRFHNCLEILREHKTLEVRY